MTEYYGKYRGTVFNNYDTDGRGKIQVQVPSVHGSDPVWARPSVPFAGPGVGFFVVPPNKANVWVEYEGGNPESPIWSGCFWGDTETAPVPASATQPQVFAIKTQTCTLTLSDEQGSGGINIEYTGGLHVKITSNSIEINAGSSGTIKVDGTKVTVNNGALEVT